jgi:lipid A 3-O-deacylase
MRARWAALLAALGLATDAAAQARWYVQVDNDAIFDTDRWYSSGMRLARVAGEAPVQLEWGLLHEIYTPEAKHWRPGVDDRAPTARLLAYAARHRQCEGFLETLELGLGVRGPAAGGRQILKAVHEIIGAREIDWSRQESDRLDVQLAAVRSHPLERFHFHYGAVAGNTNVFVHGGIDWRIGSGPALAALSPALRYAATPPPPASVSSWAVFAGASVRGVARNSLVRRNYDPLGPELEPRRAVGRAALGFVGIYGDVFTTTLTVATETREFAAQRTLQRFWALTVHVPF